MAERLPRQIESEQDLEAVRKHLQQLSGEMLIDLLMEQIGTSAGGHILQMLRDNQEKARRSLLAEYDDEIVALCEEKEPSVELIETNVRIMMEYLEAEGDPDLKETGCHMIAERMKYAVEELGIGMETGEDWRLLMLIDECER